MLVRIPFIPKDISLWLFALILVTPPLIASIAIYWLYRDSFSRGKRLYERGAFPAAARRLALAAREGYPEAARLLGEMNMSGEGFPRNPAQALACYQYAVKLFDERISSIRFWSDSKDQTHVKSEKGKIAKDPERWFTDLAERIEELAKAYPQALGLLAELRFRLGDARSALARARSLPLGDQAGCLKELLKIPADSLSPDRDESRKPAIVSREEEVIPGVKTRPWHITRVEIEQLLVFPVLIPLVKLRPHSGRHQEAPRRGAFR